MLVYLVCMFGKPWIGTLVLLIVRSLVGLRRAEKKRSESAFGWSSQLEVLQSRPYESCNNSYVLHYACDVY